MRGWEIQRVSNASNLCDHCNHIIEFIHCWTNSLHSNRKLPWKRDKMRTCLIIENASNSQLLYQKRILLNYVLYTQGYVIRWHATLFESFNSINNWKIFMSYFFINNSFRHFYTWICDIIPGFQNTQTYNVLCLRQLLYKVTQIFH